MSNTIEIQKNCRLVNEEINYLNKYWDGKFSDYVHNSIKRDLQELNNNQKLKKLQLFKELAIYAIITALGMIFFLFAIKATNTLELYLSFVLGIFFTVFGAIGGIVCALQTRYQPTR